MLKKLLSISAYTLSWAFIFASIFMYLYTNVVRKEVGLFSMLKLVKAWMGIAFLIILVLLVIISIMYVTMNKQKEMLLSKKMEIKPKMSNLGSKSKVIK